MHQDIVKWHGRSKPIEGHPGLTSETTNDGDFIDCLPLLRRAPDAAGERMNTRQSDLSYAEIQDAWPLLVPSERLEAFRLFAQADADDFFLSLNARDQAELLLTLPVGERRLWIRLLAPDDTADVIQEAPRKSRLDSSPSLMTRPGQK